MRSALLPLVIFPFLVGCAAEAEDTSSDSANLTSFSTSRTRALPNAIAVPTGTEIGVTMDAIFAAHSSGFVEERRTTSEAEGTHGEALSELAVRYRSSSDPSLTLLRRTSATVPTSDGQSFYPGVDVITLFKDDKVTERWSDHAGEDGSLDGKADRYSSEVLLRSYEDRNRDGQVDIWVEAVEKISDFDVNIFPGCTPPEKLANRILEDANFDGTFESESVTASATSATVWRCETE